MKVTTIRFLSGVHRISYEITRGVVGRRLVRNDMLLLTTVGRRSGKPHSVPLLYIRDADRLVVVASFGGRPQHPAWYLNLSANPNVDVQIRNRRLAAIASIASAEDRTRLWPRITSTYGGYSTYQNRTDRIIPVVLLHPV